MMRDISKSELATHALAPNGVSLNSAFISAAYSYTGTETVVLAAGEASNPSKQIPRAARRVMYRIIVFYVLGVLIIGMM
jgi:amino acid transporter